jgi:hypothetical protein
MLGLESVEDAQFVSVHVSGPAPAERLYIFTGSAKFDWHVDDDDSWSTETLFVDRLKFRNAPLLPQRDPRVVDHAEMGCLGSIYSRETARRDVIGFAVRQIDFQPADPLADFGEYGWRIHLSLRGNDVHLYRVNFQFTLLV